MPKPKKHVFICAQNRPQGHPRGCCAARGGNELLQAFWQETQRRDLFDTVSVTFAGCLGPCDIGPNIVVYPEGVMYSGVTKADVAAIFDEHVVGGVPVARLLAPEEMWS